MMLPSSTARLQIIEPRFHSYVHFAFLCAKELRFISKKALLELSVSLPKKKTRHKNASLLFLRALRLFVRQKIISKKALSEPTDSLPQKKISIKKAHIVSKNHNLYLIAF